MGCKGMGAKEAFAQNLDSNSIKATPNIFIMPLGEHGNGWVDYENQLSRKMAHLFNHSALPCH